MMQVKNSNFLTRHENIHTKNKKKYNNTILICVSKCVYNHTHVCILIICSQCNAPLPAGGGWWHLAGDQQFQLATLVSLCECESVCLYCMCVGSWFSEYIVNTWLFAHGMLKKSGKKDLSAPIKVVKKTKGIKKKKKEAIPAWFNL